tara:strand:+ start:2097 stop:2987 length:891 start_codon:yes stop_codon:yes gene_type:complete
VYPNEENNIDKESQGYKELLFSALSFSLMTVCVKKLGGRIPVSELIFVRALISLIITRYMLYRKKISPWGINKKLLLIRGILGTGALFCIFKAIELLPLASATILQYTYPTFTSLAAWVFLKEKLNRRIIVALLIGWLGIILVGQPKLLIQTGINLSIQSICIALSGALLTSLAYVCVRKLSEVEDELVIIHYFPLISLPITIPSILKIGVFPSGIEWLWLLGIGIFTQIGQIGVTRGLSLLPAGKASAINYTQVLFATIFGISMFSEPISANISVGGLLILTSTIINISAKQKIS